MKQIKMVPENLKDITFDELLELYMILLENSNNLIKDNIKLLQENNKLQENNIELMETIEQLIKNNFN